MSTPALDRPWDLDLCVAYTATVTVLLLAFQSGNPVALLLLLFVPGYVLVSVLFPGKSGADPVTRFTLSVGLSFVAVVVFGLILAFTAIGLSMAPLTIAIAASTIGLAIVAYVRRARLPAGERFRIVFPTEGLLRTPLTTSEKALLAVLAAGMVVVAYSVAAALLSPPMGTRFTEFYLLGPTGSATGYPERLNVSETATVIVGMRNHEFRTVPYTLRIDLVEIEYRFNGTAQEVIELSRATRTWFNVTLASGGTWEGPYPFSIGQAGTWKVEFILYLDGVLSPAHPPLQLFVTVSPP